MKCLCLFSGENKKNFISLSSAESAQRVVMINNSLVSIDEEVKRNSIKYKWCNTKYV